MATPSSTQKIQLGVETTAGNCVAATTILRLAKVARIKDTREVKLVPENIGILVGGNRSYTPKVQAELDLPDNEATFEQLPYWLAAGIKNVVTGSADGSGAKVYDYPFPTSTTPNTIKTYTIEAGDLQDAERMGYGFVSELNLSGQRDQAVMVGGKWIGQQSAVNAFSGTLSAPTVETILFNKCSLAIDDTGGTLGNTSKANTMISFKLACKTGWKVLPVGDGTLYFGSIGFSDPSVDLDLTFIYDSNATTAKTKWTGETAVLVQMKFTGSALSGSTYTAKTLIINIAGKWQSFDIPTEKDGFQVCTGKLHAGLDSAASLFAEIIVVNALTTLP